MIALKGKSNLRDSAEFGLLEVARGPRSQIMRADHSVVSRMVGCDATVTVVVEKGRKITNKK
jgi:hypothetical protein